MAISEKQKQKKLAKKNSKRKLTKLPSNIGSQQRLSPSYYASFPIHECFAPNTLFVLGIGYVIITRRAPYGLIAISVFVVDVHCLGVKNALFKVSSEFEYENTVNIIFTTLMETRPNDGSKMFYCSTKPASRVSNTLKVNTLRVRPSIWALVMLKPYAGKLACTVRREWLR